MEGFIPCNDVEAYFAKLRSLGYVSKRLGEGSQTVNRILVQHVAVIKGNNLPPCVFVAWIDTRDSDLVLYSTRRFADEQTLANWLQGRRIVLSRHNRRL